MISNACYNLFERIKKAIFWASINPFGIIGILNVFTMILYLFLFIYLFMKNSLNRESIQKHAVLKEN